MNNMWDYFGICFIVVVIYYFGVMLASAYILFWNMDCHTDYTNTMKTIHAGHAWKSYYFFFVKNKLMFK